MNIEPACRDCLVGANGTTLLVADVRRRRAEKRRGVLEHGHAGARHRARGRADSRETAKRDGLRWRHPAALSRAASARSRLLLGGEPADDEAVRPAGDDGHDGRCSKTTCPPAPAAPVEPAAPRACPLPAALGSPSPSPRARNAARTGAQNSAVTATMPARSTVCLRLAHRSVTRRRTLLLQPMPRTQTHFPAVYRGKPVTLRKARVFAHLVGATQTSVVARDAAGDGIARGIASVPLRSR